MCLIEVERRPKEDLPFLVLADEVGTVLPRSFLDAVLLRSVERGARKQGIWGEWEGTGLHFFSERHSPRPEGADADALNEYVVLFAKHLAAKARKVLQHVRLARGESVEPTRPKEGGELGSRQEDPAAGNEE